MIGLQVFLLHKYHTSLDIFIAYRTIEETIDVFEIGVSVFIDMSGFDSFLNRTEDEIKQFFIWFKLGKNNIWIQYVNIEDMT